MVRVLNAIPTFASKFKEAERLRVTAISKPAPLWTRQITPTLRRGNMTVLPRRARVFKATPV